MKTQKLTFAAVAASLLLALPAFGEEIHVYNWSDYIDEALLGQFTEKTGIKVIYDVFDSNEVLETKLLAGSTGYDVVVPSGSFLSRQITAGVFQKLDKSKLSNIGNVWSDIAKQTAIYDPGNAYSINYMWGTTGIGYNVDKVKEVLGPDAPVNSLSLIFDPKNMEKLAKCGVYFLDAPTEMIPAALRYLGEDPDSKDKAVLAKAEPILQAVRPYVQKFNSSEYINALANGDICVAFGWSGDVLQARDRAAEADNGVTIEYSIPKEGSLLWFDQLAIPADAPNPEGALKFINFMLEAKVAAAASNYVYYANGNKASQAFLNEDVIGDTAIYPDANTVNKLYITTPYDAKTQKFVTRMWTRIKTGY
ncbi:MAG: polyamine ABC transporter substrate-binding protein [Alphaproteobacteria bacterium]|nr:polyamine ABC transporter substrate-binding protein [Alphaproteobacteria bacterium]